MGAHEKSDKRYMKIAFGSIRENSTQSDPKAKARTNEKTGDVYYERVYSFVDGILEDVSFYSHDEYGNSWNIHIKDGGEEFVLQVKEDSRYGIDFLKKLPNLKKGKKYKFTAYDWTKNDQRRVGVSIEDCHTQEKIGSYYQSFEGSGENLRVTNLHGFPEFEGESWKDKDDVKIYFTKLAKFLRTNSKKFIENWKAEPDNIINKKDIDNSGTDKIAQEILTPEEIAGNDDLPF